MNKYNENPKRTRWQYTCVKSDYDAVYNEDQLFAEKLNEYGVEGYELVSIFENHTTNALGMRQKHLTAYMKRKYRAWPEGDDVIIEYE